MKSMRMRRVWSKLFSAICNVNLFDWFELEFILWKDTHVHPYIIHMTSASSFHSTFQNHLRTYKRAVLLFVFSISESGSTAAKVTRALFSIITQTFNVRQITELICLHTVVDDLNVTTFISLMSLLRWHQVFTWFSSSVSSVAYWLLKV